MFTFFIQEHRCAMATLEPSLVLLNIDSPENIEPNTVYFAIKVSDTEIKLASSVTNAQNGVAITVFKGTKLFDPMPNSISFAARSLGILIPALP